MSSFFVTPIEKKIFKVTATKQKYVRVMSPIINNRTTKG